MLISVLKNKHEFRFDPNFRFWVQLLVWDHFRLKPTSGWNPLPIGAHNWFLGPLPEVGPNQKSGSKKNTQKCNKTSSCNIIIITPDIVHRYLFLKEIKLFLTFLFRDLLTVYHCYVSKWVCLQFLFNLPTYLPTFWFHNSLFFYKSQCTAISDSTMFGTCMTDTECSSKSGTVDGNCAAGFGVCCTFV